MKIYGRGVMTALFVLILLPRLSFVAPEGKTKIAMISFGDDIENKTWIKGWKQNYNTKAKIEEAIRQAQGKGLLDHLLAHALGWSVPRRNRQVQLPSSVGSGTTRSGSLKTPLTPGIRTNCGGLSKSRIGWA